jgi:hypothetical protein
MVGASATVEEVFKKTDNARERDSTLFPKRPFAGMREPEYKNEQQSPKNPRGEHADIGEFAEVLERGNRAQIKGARRHF